jgi:undecaprenyl-diphosphatase
MTGAGILQFAAKWAVDRPRPNLSPLGFPSGHVLCLVVLFGMICYVLSVADIGRRVQRTAIALCGATVFAVAISRLYLDAHWLSDVMGGFAIGFAYLATIVRFIPGQPRRALDPEVPALELADAPPALAPIR